MWLAIETLKYGIWINDSSSHGYGLVFSSGFGLIRGRSHGISFGRYLYLAMVLAGVAYFAAVAVAAGVLDAVPVFLLRMGRP